ncbi:MAG: hydrogenase 3 maturation endopeptidase HyCI [Phycisphaerae bacterium]|nr:hydrogenase 3 maturation endopeptidase HyCI [Phycisphaerae bacterium]
MQTLQTLRTNLQQRLEDASRIAILGIGSELRADDAAGILVAERVQFRIADCGLRIEEGTRGKSEIRNPTTPPQADACCRVSSAKSEIKTASAQLAVFLGGTAPENLTGEIKRFGPTHLVIIDAADLDAEPGTITIMDPDRIGGTTFCTHSLPLKVMIDYLLQSFDCHVTIIGIQPKSLAVGAPVSKEVLDAVESLSALLLEALPRP